MGDPAGEIETNRTALLPRMASALARAEFEELGPAVAAKAKLCLLDFLACAFASRRLPWSREALTAATRGSTSRHEGAATIIGTDTRAAPADAAFANAVLGHALVRDDMHLGSVSHLGVVVIPPVLALAEQRPVSGRELLTALAVGYEAGGKLGRAILDVEVARVFRPTGITGPFAGAAAAAALLDLDESRTAHALAFAANAAAGYNEWAATGGSEMFFHPGFGAANALRAVELARAGALASATALDGPAGMLAAFGKRSARALPLPFIDGAEILDVFFKEVPACNFAQSAAQAARAIAASARLAPERIERVVVGVPFAAQAYPGCDWAGPFESVLKAKMSIHYNVAAVLATGTFDEPNYEPQRQPRIVALANRVALEVDDALTRAYPAKQGARVRVIETDGREHEAEVSDVAPAVDALVRERFVAAARATLGESAAAELLAAIDALDTAADAGAIARLTRVA